MEDSSRKRKDDKNDKYMGSLSEGQKHRESSSGSEVGDIDIDDDDEEERIIEMRRKKREELMKVNLKGKNYPSSIYVYQIIAQWQVYL